MLQVYTQDCPPDSFLASLEMNFPVPCCEVLYDYDDNYDNYDHYIDNKWISKNLVVRVAHLGSLLQS